MQDQKKTEEMKGSETLSRGDFLKLAGAREARYERKNVQYYICKSEAHV